MSGGKYRDFSRSFRLCAWRRITAPGKIQHALTTVQRLRNQCIAKQAKVYVILPVGQHSAKEVADCRTGCP